MAPTLLLWVRFWKSAIIQSFNKHGLGIYLVPGMIIGPGDRDLRTYITPWPQGVHTQQGFTDRLQYGIVGWAGAPQPGQGRTEFWVRESFPQGEVPK